MKRHITDKKWEEAEMLVRFAERAKSPSGRGG